MAEQPQTTKIAMVVVLAVALTVVLLAQSGILPIGSGKGHSLTPAGKAGTPAPAATTDANVGLKSQVTWTRPDPVGLVSRDPTRVDMSHTAAASNGTSITAAGATDPQYLVAGVTFSTEQPSSVIIDGHVLHEGDTIYGATVVKITEGSAELSRAGKSWTVKPGQEYRGSELIRSEN